MLFYNKLVRDRIPEVIIRNGKKFSTRILDNEEYIEELKKKSFEELEDTLKHKLMRKQSRNWQIFWKSFMYWPKFMVLQCGMWMISVKVKRKKRGGFRDKVFLIDVED